MAVKTKPPGWIEPGSKIEDVPAIRCATAGDGRCYADVLDIAAYMERADQREAGAWFRGLALRHLQRPNA